MRAFAADLRSRRYDVVLDTQGLMHSGSMARLAVGRSHGYDALSIREPLAAFSYDVRHRVSRNLGAIERNRRLTALALQYSFAAEVDYGLMATWRRVQRPAPYAVLVHATSRPEKTWPIASWLRVGNALSLRGLNLVLPAGSAAERERAALMADALGGAVAPPTLPFERTLGLILDASLVIGVDTGLLHLAGALDVPTVAVFTSSNPTLTGPLGRGPIVIVGRKDGPPAVEDVLAAVDVVMSRAALSSGVVARREGVDDGRKDFVYADVARPAVSHVGAMAPPALGAGY